MAPSTELRRGFGHDPDRWEEFRSRYCQELADNAGQIGYLLERARRGRVTLVYGARDRRRNNAVVLREYLEERLNEEPLGPKGRCLDRSVTLESPYGIHQRLARSQIPRRYVVAPMHARLDAPAGDALRDDPNVVGALGGHPRTQRQLVEPADLVAASQ